MLTGLASAPPLAGKCCRPSRCTRAKQHESDVVAPTAQESSQHRARRSSGCLSTSGTTATIAFAAPEAGHGPPAASRFWRAPCPGREAANVTWVLVQVASTRCFRYLQLVVAPRPGDMTYPVSGAKHAMRRDTSHVDTAALVSSPGFLGNPQGCR